MENKRLFKLYKIEYSKIKNTDIEHEIDNIIEELTKKGYKLLNISTRRVGMSPAYVVFDLMFDYLGEKLKSVRRVKVDLITLRHNLTDVEEIVNKTIKDLEDNNCKIVGMNSESIGTSPIYNIYLTIYEC